MSPLDSICLSVIIYSIWKENQVRKKKNQTKTPIYLIIVLRKQIFVWKLSGFCSQPAQKCVKKSDKLFHSSGQSHGPWHYDKNVWSHIMVTCWAIFTFSQDLVINLRKYPSIHHCWPFMSVPNNIRRIPCVKNPNKNLCNWQIKTLSSGPNNSTSQSNTHNLTHTNPMEHHSHISYLPTYPKRYQCLPPPVKFN